VHKNEASSHFVLWLLTFLMRSAPNLAQINVISFLTLHRYLLKTTLENEVTPSTE